MKNEEAQISLEKRKKIPPPEDMACRAGLIKKKRKRAKTPPKAKAAEPTPENPVAVEDEDEASLESLDYRWLMSSH